MHPHPIVVCKLAQEYLNQERTLSLCPLCGEISYAAIDAALAKYYYNSFFGNFRTTLEIKCVASIALVEIIQLIQRHKGQFSEVLMVKLTFKSITNGDRTRDPLIESHRPRPLDHLCPKLYSNL